MRKVKCCEKPSINGRWCYSGGTLIRGYCYCKNCEGSWEYDSKQKKLVKKSAQAVVKS